MRRARTVLRALLTNDRTVAAMCVGSALLVCGLTGHMLLELRRQTWDAAMQGAQNLLVVLAQDIDRNFEIYDLSLHAVKDGLRIPGLAGMAPDLRHAILFDRATTAHHLAASLVLDRNGAVVEDSASPGRPSGTLADRDVFVAHRDRPDLGLFIGAPFHDPATGDHLVAFSRRIEADDGSFNGVVASTLRLDHFQDLFRKVRLGKQGRLALLRTDGTVLMRFPLTANAIGRRVPPDRLNILLGGEHGRMKVPPLLDDVPRVVNFRRVGQLPLIVTVALSEVDIFAAWTARAVVIACVLGVLCLAMGGFGVILSRELRRRFRAEAEMRGSEAQFRLLAEHCTDVIIRLDAGMVQRYVSPSCRAVLGFEPEGLVGQPTRGLVHPEDWPGVLRGADKARRCAGHSGIEYRIRRRDGRDVWVEGHYGFVAEDGGFTVILRDVSQRKDAERDLAEAHAELTRLAATDSLTGLANRRRFDEAVRNEWRRAAREQLPLSLLLLDIDRFKQFNDRYGHQEGDGCLRVVARAVGSCARRPADLVARYGGEEIAILLPGAERGVAASLAERVRQAVAATRVPHEGNRSGGGVVTASIGGATVLPFQEEMEPGIDRLIAAADRALYVAKAEGRDRVRFQQEPEPLLLEASG